MQKIIPHLWFDTQAKEAAEFYAELFPNSSIKSITVIPDTTQQVASFTIGDLSIVGFNAGPHFKFNQSISFLLNFDPSADTNARENLDRTWAALTEGGTIMMGIGEYPFSKRYGWVQDRFGVSWQLMLTNPDGAPRPFATPVLLFTGDVYGKAESAIEHYSKVFAETSRGLTVTYPEGAAPHQEGSLMFGDFNLHGTWFAAMDGAGDHKFKFTEALSFLINCDTQDEIDYFWDSLSGDPDSGNCGWIKDPFGVSWQIWPTVLGQMLSDGSAEQKSRLTKAFLSMKKFDIEALKAVY